ncbi:MAG: hypothetical protein HFH67_00680 [Lachnospiraceae bacterium]|nr:hypothetical protein [Lachnospiraceae bacterium]
MQKEKILFTAISKNLSIKQIGENSSTSFKVVHECIDMIYITKIDEETKKKKLISCLQSFWRGKSKYVSGCKREQIRKIAKLVFGIENENWQSLCQEINNFTFQELYLYYYYIEQIARGDKKLYEIILKNYKEKQKINEEKRKEKREEKQKEKEKLEQEKQEKLEKMSKEARWEHEICKMGQDKNYFQRLCNNEFDDTDIIKVAKVLKQYWKDNKMWEGNKVNKKQTERIKRIKDIVPEEIVN